jgi:hypothetical protein
VDSYVLIGYGGGGGGGDGGSAQSPDITGHPQSAAYTKGASAAALTVTAASPDGGTLSYQWYKDDDTDRANGSETPVGTNSVSYTAPTDAEGTFYYYVAVTNTLGGKSASAASAPAEITVTAPGIVNAQVPVISAQPQNATYTQGASAAPLTVTASVSDAGTLHYQWYRNTVNSNYEGILINGADGLLSSGAAGGNYTPPATTGGTFYYYVEVTNTITDNLDGGVKSQTTASAAVKITVSTLFLVTTDTQWNYALETIGKSGSGTAAAWKDYTIQINGSFSVPYNADTVYSFGYSAQYLTVNLTGNGTVSLGSNLKRYLLMLRANQTLVIDGAGLILQGRPDNEYSLVYLDSASAALELRNGVITDNGTSSSGGGVRVGNGALFTMSGGEISNNRSNSSNSGGGGVYVDNGVFFMSGGEISGNYSGGSGGGGVRVYNGGTFTMSGGKISGNTASGSDGGGVYVANGGTFTMSSGEISGNTASGYGGGDGGGVYAYYGTFNKSGNSVIYGYNSADSTNPLWNKARSGELTYGHAVYYYKNSGYDKYYCDTTLTAGDDISTSVLPTSGTDHNWTKK